MPSLPHLGSRTPLSLLRQRKNHREQQEMNPTSKGAGQAASPLTQLYRLASQILKTPSDWLLLTHITEGPETLKFHPYPTLPIIPYGIVVREGDLESDYLNLRSTIHHNCI